MILETKCIPSQDAEIPRPGAEVLEFQAGDTVELEGLKAAPELNGRTGTVLKYDADKGRYHVKVHDSVVRDKFSDKILIGHGESARAHSYIRVRRKRKHGHFGCWRFDC